MANLVLEEIEVYQRAMKFSEEIHGYIEGWKSFYQWTTGKQLLESSDSIAANIAEGYGRYFYKENRNFCFYARGSLTETKTWISKARNRNLIPQADAINLLSELETIHKMLNAYINSIGRTTDH